MTTSVASHVARNARKFPGRLAITDEHGRLTYGELDDRAARLAAHLAAEGIGPGDKVALLAKSSANWVIGYLATLKLRGTCVPLNTRLTPSDIEANLNDARCKFVLTTADLLQTHVVPHSRLPFVLLDDDPGDRGLRAILGRDASGFCAPAPGDDDLQLIMFTGGTTGRSKGVMLRNRQVFWNTVHEALDTRMHEFDNTILATPLHHAAALNCWLLPHLYLGARVTIMTDYGADKMLDMIAEHKVTNGFAPPSMARELCIAAEQRSPERLASWQRWYVGGGILSAKDRDRMHALAPDSKIFYQYGLTEAGVIVTVLKEEDYALAPDSIGRPFINFEVKIAREDLSDASAGEEGEILVRGPSVMDGYFERPDATAAAFHGDWLRTGDMGTMDANGYVYFHDRLKDMVKTGGLNVYSQEVERALQKHPGIREVGIVGLPSERWGEEVTAVVVRREGTTLGEQDVIDFAKEHLASYKAPKRVVFVPYEEMPINYSGKIIKRELRTRIAALIAHPR